MHPRLCPHLGHNLSKVYLPRPLSLHMWQMNVILYVRASTSLEVGRFRSSLGILEVGMSSFIDAVRDVGPSFLEIRLAKH